VLVVAGISTILLDRTYRGRTENADLAPGMPKLAADEA
jgi:hypothetical protein